jgi:hypothetical protein
MKFPALSSTILAALTLNAIAKPAITVGPTLPALVPTQLIRVAQASTLGCTERSRF